MVNKFYRPLFYLSVFLVIFAFIVVQLGAYTRLKEAGLGCPDWPFCYGQVLVPKTAQAIQAAEQAYQQPVEPAKAWPEMIHRYMAGILGLLILGLAALALWRGRDWRLRVPVYLLLALVIFQALLGKWTVTLLLYPPVVMGHLLGGMLILAIALWLAVQTGYRSPVPLPVEVKRLKIWALLALIIVFGQIALGGWTSANYAGPICPDFPTCQGQWWPLMDVLKGFNLTMPVGANFQGGALDNLARIAIHFVHRLGAMVVFILVLALVARILLIATTPALRKLAGCIMVLLLAQIFLGIVLVLAHFPLIIAVAHNGVAALLLLALVGLNAILFACSTQTANRQSLFQQKL